PRNVSTSSTTPRFMSCSPASSTDVFARAGRKRNCAMSLPRYWSLPHEQSRASPNRCYAALGLCGVCNPWPPERAAFRAASHPRYQQPLWRLAHDFSLPRTSSGGPMVCRTARTDPGRKARVPETRPQTLHPVLPDRTGVVGARAAEVGPSRYLAALQSLAPRLARAYLRMKGRRLLRRICRGKL